jgi:hypothetical protein
MIHIGEIKEKKRNSALEAFKFLYACVMESLHGLISVLVEVDIMRTQVSSPEQNIIMYKIMQLT